MCSAICNHFCKLSQIPLLYFQFSQNEVKKIIKVGPFLSNFYSLWHVFKFLTALTRLRSKKLLWWLNNSLCPPHIVIHISSSRSLGITSRGSVHRVLRSCVFWFLEKFEKKNLLKVYTSIPTTVALQVLNSCY